MTTNYKATEVYGITRELPLNYVERPLVDAKLVANLTRDKHLVIFGSSKQGKTSLRKHALRESDYIVVHCSNKWSVADLHAAILKRAGFEVTQATSKSSSGKQKILAKLSGTLFGLGAESSIEAERVRTTQTTTAPLELDSEDVNDIIAALKSISFDKYIVLEDFHYLVTDTQKDFSVALKAFHESSAYCFIVIGVWLEENRLTVYNGDLTGRLFSIDADRWEPGELHHVISNGERLLNIEFGATFKEYLLENCFGSVYLVQETCYQCCEKYAIRETLEKNSTIGNEADAAEILLSVINQQSGRFFSFIVQFADGFQTTALEMHRWLLYPVLTASIEDLRRGLRYNDIRQTLQGVHPSGAELNAGNITQALQSCSPLQVKKELKPLILDYDQTNLRLRVVDSSFLIWLDKQNRNDLLAMVDLPKIEA